MYRAEVEEADDEEPEAPEEVVDEGLGVIVFKRGVPVIDVLKRSDEVSRFEAVCVMLKDD